jgi:hypothetical protein
MEFAASIALALTVATLVATHEPEPSTWAMLFQMPKAGYRSERRRTKCRIIVEKVRLNFFDRLRMTGEQSRRLKVGDKVCWQNDQADRGTVTERNWSGLTIKWDSRGEQRVLHNDMGGISLVSNKWAWRRRTMMTAISQRL